MINDVIMINSPFKSTDIDSNKLMFREEDMNLYKEKEQERMDNCVAFLGDDSSEDDLKGDFDDLDEEVLINN